MKWKFSGNKAIVLAILGLHVLEFSSAEESAQIVKLSTDDRLCMVCKDVQPGATVKIKQCNDPHQDDTKLWTISDDGYWRTYQDTNLCVEPVSVKEGGGLRLAKCGKKTRQRWDFHDQIKPEKDMNLCASYDDPSAGNDIYLTNCKKEGASFIVKKAGDGDGNGNGNDNDNDIDNGNDNGGSPPSSNKESFMLVSYDEDGTYETSPRFMCLSATNGKRGLVKNKECDTKSSKMLWTFENGQLRPVSDKSLCVEWGEVDTDPSSIHCCVDDDRIRLAACGGKTSSSRGQKWIYKKDLGFIQPSQYQSHEEGGLCLSAWFPPRIGLEHCRVDWQSQDPRWHMVKPGDFKAIAKPDEEDAQSDDLFTIQSGTWQIKCDWHCELIDCSDDRDGDECNTADTLWIMNDNHIRKGSDLSRCLTYDHGYRRMYEGKCMSYKDDNQKWKFNKNGDSELSPQTKSNFCLFKDVDTEEPTFKTCNGGRDQSWDMGAFDSSSCEKDSSDSYRMIVLEGGGGYYCASTWGTIDDDSELGMAKCDPYDDSMLFELQGSTWRPKIDLSYCVEPATDDWDDPDRWLLKIKKCDGSKRQKFNHPSPNGDGSGSIESPMRKLCASFVEGSWYNIQMLPCKNSSSKQTFQQMKPSAYRAPQLRYIHLSTSNDLSQGISCYPDTEENTCPGYRPIELTSDKFHTGSKWFVEETKQGIRLRLGEPYGDVLEVDGEDTWKYNKSGKKELKSVNQNRCIEVRGDRGGGTTGHLTLASCNSGKWQRWALQDTEEYLYEAGASEFGDPDDSDLHLLVAREADHLCIAATEPYARHPVGDLILAPCDPSDGKQVWAVEEINGATRMRPLGNLNTCMYVSKMKLLEQLRLHECDDDQVKQKWSYKSNAISPYKASASKLCVSYEDATCQPAAGKAVQLVPCDGGGEQMFDMVSPDKF